MKKHFTTRKIVLTGIFITLTYLAPFLTGQLGELGRRLSPMHLPILLAGFACGAPGAVVAGLVTPILRSVTAGMPPLFPTAISMSFELATYGLIAGVLYKKLPKKTIYIYVALFAAMIGGRLVGGGVSALLLGLSGGGYTFSIFISTMFVAAIPGMIMQVVLVPLIVIALKEAKLLD